MKNLYLSILGLIFSFSAFAISPILGTTTLCAGSTTVLTDATGGGTWASSNTAVATVSGSSLSGMVTGVAPGTAVITYTAGGFDTTAVVIVNPAPAAITGPTIVCGSGSITLTDLTAGGTWSSGAVTIATVGVATGVVTGVAYGTAGMTYTLATGCSAHETITVSASPSAITGSTTVCTGLGTILSDATGGGTWSSSDALIATIGLTTGVVDGISPGTATISYTTSCGTVTIDVTVLVGPTAISGSSTLCVGATETLTDGTSGGVWTTSATCMTIGAGTGVLTGISAGLGEISYTTTSGCVTTKTVSVMGSTAIGSITGPSSVCTGSTITLADLTSGGTWSSSDLSIATVTSAGVVTGVAAGTVNIIYSVLEACGTVTATQAVTVTSTGSAGTISGTAVITVGGTSMLSETVSGGTWSSSNTSVATVGSGDVTGVAPGTAIISYAVAGCSGTLYATYVITVSTVDLISGHIRFSGSYSGSVKVWLITYNSGTSMLEAVDSTTVTCSGDSVYYQFTGEPTDSFRIKAAIPSFTGTGFIPTYHTSSYYWYSATVLGHTSGTSDINQDINMATGTSTGGPGFIGGDVTSGANRGTSGSATVSGITMYLLNTVGTLLQQSVTDASGHYLFTSLPLGTYFVHPEAMNYVSTNYIGISLTPTQESMTSANFIQHTVSHTIIPGTTGIVPVNPSASAVVTFPNPTSGKLNIQWQENATENGTISVADITGRQVFSAAINMTAGSGLSTLDLSGLNSGLYIISIKSGDINYNNKITIQH